MKRLGQTERGFTLVELLITGVVFGIVATSMLALFTGLVHSAVVAKRAAVALSLANNQMEYLKSLPYDSLAVAGGSIPSSSPLPASTTKTLDGVTYTVKTEISYVDDAFDGCGSYPNLTIEQQECRNYPPPSGAPSPDQNPADYKILDVTVMDPSGTQLAEVDTEVAARVSETASSTGALFVSVLDDSGAPISGATVTVTNSNKLSSPLSDSTDTNGIAIFYGLPPDTSGYHYTINATKSGYSSLATITPSGSLQPTYPSQNILTQQSSYVTLTLRPQGTNSLVVETTDTSGNPISNAKVYIKGGYKKYSSASDTSYYYDNMTPSDSRPTTDASGLTALTNLVPGAYIFCGDKGATGCSVGGTTYYLAAAVPYGGTNTLNPVDVPIYDTSNPPTQTFSYNSTNYLQKVRLMLTTSSSFPRLSQLSPAGLSATDPSLANFGFTLTGTNLPCSSDPTSCATSVKFTQSGNTYIASCTGDTTNAVQLTCTVNLTGITAGATQLIVSTSSGTLTLPSTPLIGGFVVTSS